MSKNVVLIAGKKGSGKDYVAKALSKAFKQSCSIHKFADPIKKLISETIGCTVPELDFWKDSNCSITLPNGKEVTIRSILQRFGNEAMKPKFGNDVWSIILCTKALASKSDIVLVPDWRFYVEYQLVYIQFRLFTIRVIDNNLPCNDAHSSENELNDFAVDFTIDNTGKKDLTLQIDACVEAYLNKYPTGETNE